MAFMGNDAVRRVNLHYGILALAQSAGSIFVLVFLLRASISVPVALSVQAAIVAGRFVMRPALLPLARRWGLKPLLIIGTLGLAVQYPILAEVRGIGFMLFLLVFVISIAEVFYWVAYNAYFASIGDPERRGREVGAREALVALASAVAPFLGAWALVVAGPRLMFAGVALIQAAAVIPLIGVPNVPVRQTAPGAFRAARLGVALLAIDGWFDASFIFTWQVALFLTLRESIPAYGGAMALAGLIGGAGSMLLGRHVDAGHGRRTVAIAYSATMAVVVLRAVSLGVPWAAVVANALGALVMPLLLPVLGTPCYNLSRASPCAFRFQMAAEIGWDIGCCGGCLAAAALYAAGISLAPGILLGLPALAAGAILLRRYYGRVSSGAASVALAAGDLSGTRPGAIQ